MAILPMARALYLCDYHVGYSNGKVDLYGLFNTIRPQHGFPHARTRFCVFAQLSSGLRRVPFSIDIRFADTDERIYQTKTSILTFPNRKTIVRMAAEIAGCSFPSPGLNLVELICENTWVCDTALLLAE